MMRDVGEFYVQVMSALSPSERLRLATLILNDLVHQGGAVADIAEAHTNAGRAQQIKAEGKIVHRQPVGAERSTALDEMVTLSEGMGLYD